MGGAFGLSLTGDFRSALNYGQLSALPAQTHVEMKTFIFQQYSSNSMIEQFLPFELIGRLVKGLDQLFSFKGFIPVPEVEIPDAHR